MIEISAQKLNKYFGINCILKDVSFHINSGEKVGIVGPNGAGKTTLLKIISSQMDYDSGEIFIRNEFGYLSQTPSFNEDKTVFEIMEDVYREEVRKGRDDIFESMVGGTLKSMAFPESTFHVKVSRLSGGEKTRLALAVLILKKPPLLMLDEPTNHLDLGTLEWLESVLMSYRGSLLVVSHDRFFLDKIVDKILDLEVANDGKGSKITEYKGNYTDFAKKKRLLRESQLKEYDKQQTEIKRQEEMIRTFKQHGTEKLAKRAASREKMLNRITPIDKPQSIGTRAKIQFKQKFKSGKDVLFAEDISKEIGERLLFENVNFDIKSGEKIAMVGANGIGKTTLLKMIMRGEGVKQGHNVMLAYYDQEQKDFFNMDLTLLEELNETYRLYTDTELRKILGRFLFTANDVFKKIRDLSGGERARLSLLKLMLSGANTLLLDEPTNHLDIESKEVFEEALIDFPGTVFAISHDRYFLKKIPSRIFELTSNGIVDYKGSYDYYMEKRSSIDRNYLKDLTSKREGSIQASDKEYEQASTGDAALSRRLKKEAEAKERRRLRRIEEVENFIEEKETSVENLESDIEDPEIALNPKKLMDVANELEKEKSLLDKAYLEWESLH